MKIEHPLMQSKAAAISVNGMTLQKSIPVTIPLANVTDEIRALEKAGELRIVVRGNKAMLVKL